MTTIESPSARFLLEPLPPLPDLSDGSCVGSELFFDEADELVPLLQRVCARCDVRGACLEVALRTAPSFCVGIWAGTTSSDRARLRSEAGITFAKWSAPTLMECLTGEPVTRIRQPHRP